MIKNNKPKGKGSIVSDFDELSKTNSSDGLNAYRKEALAAARDFKYDADIVERVKNAKTHGEIMTAMVTGRKRWEKKLSERDFKQPKTSKLSK